MTAKAGRLPRRSMKMKDARMQSMQWLSTVSCGAIAHLSNNLLRLMVVRLWSTSE